MQMGIEDSYLEDMRSYSENPDSPTLECLLCKVEFDIESENGGVEGHFGRVHAAFCAYCLAAITDMIEQRCPTCMKETE